jgi:hypothetical protein
VGAAAQERAGAGPAFADRPGVPTVAIIPSGTGVSAPPKQREIPPLSILNVVMFKAESILDAMDGCLIHNADNNLFFDTKNC